MYNLTLNQIAKYIFIGISDDLKILIGQKAADNAIWSNNMK